MVGRHWWLVHQWHPTRWRITGFKPVPRVSSRGSSWKRRFRARRRRDARRTERSKRLGRARFDGIAYSASAATTTAAHPNGARSDSPLREFAARVGDFTPRIGSPYHAAKLKCYKNIRPVSHTDGRRRPPWE